MELQDARPQDALGLIARAAASAPDDARFQFGLGQALQALGRWEEAADAYQRVLRAQPDSLDAHMALGVALQRAGRLGPAAAAYQEILARRPDDPSALGNLGTVRRELGDLEAAVELLKRAAGIEPEAASHAVNLGIALCQRRDFRAAETILRTTLAREPDNVEAAFNLGNAMRGLHRSTEAVEHYRRAVQLRPDHAEALNNLGNALMELGEFSAAMAAFDAALHARPTYVAAINNAGCLLRMLGRSDDAEDMLRRGLAIDPGHAALYDNLGNVLKDAGELDEAIACYRRSLTIDPSNAATHSNLAYALCFQSADPQPILEECLRWNARFADPLPRCENGPARELSCGLRLKIGYVSADFREHCQSLFTIPLLARHDPAAVEVFCYSSVERPDEYTRRISGLAHAWRDVRALDDVALCEAIRADRIDVLVDLTMHMARGRPLVFARKPAPVQIAWLAYPGTTGIAAMDYRLSDPRLDPDGFEGHYSERTLRLADSFWCYDPLISGIDPGPLPALERGHVTLGCLNNPCKLTDDTLRLWGPVMSCAAGCAAQADGSGGTTSAPPARASRRARRRRATRRIRRVSAAGGVSAHLSRHRFRARYVALQRPHHEPGRALDGCAHRDARRPDLCGARRIESIVSFESVRACRLVG